MTLALQQSRRPAILLFRSFCNRHFATCVVSTSLSCRTVYEICVCRFYLSKDAYALLAPSGTHFNLLTCRLHSPTLNLIVYTGRRTTQTSKQFTAYMHQWVTQALCESKRPMLTAKCGKIPLRICSFFINTLVVHINNKVTPSTAPSG